MATVDLQTVTSNLLKLDSSPLNHASAVIEELEAAQSEEVSVDVQITKEEVERDEQVVQQEEQEVVQEEVAVEEEAPVEEQVVEEEEEVEQQEEVVASNGVSSEETVSEVTDSDDELEKEAAQDKETSEVIVTSKTVRRRSERIRKKHEGCSGALFSDDELPAPETDNISTTSSQEARDTDRRSLLLRIFLLFILLAVVSNALIYIYLSCPAISDNISHLSSSFLGLFKSDSPAAEL